MRPNSADLNCSMSATRLHGSYDVPEGLYAETGSAQDDASKLWSDRVSDFDQLSPAMQRTFGTELCDYLRDFYQAPTHCDYPFHRR